MPSAVHHTQCAGSNVRSRVCARTCVVAGGRRHACSGADGAVAMRGDVAAVMVKVARHLFTNGGFNALCASLTREFQKRSSKVMEQDHVKLLHLTWFMQRLHRTMER